MNEERKKAKVGGSFAVHGSTYREYTLDVTGLSVEEIARKLEDRAETPALCHECGREVSDPELMELGGLQIDGVYYIPRGDGTWQEYKP